VARRESDDKPLLVAAESQRVYVLEAFAPQDEPSPATTRCRLHTLDPTRDTVEMEAEYRRSMGDVTRLTTWRFVVGGEALRFETRFDPDYEIDDREAVAQQIALALGWQFPQRQAIEQAA
jgi:hypothetical protein